MRFGSRTKSCCAAVAVLCFASLAQAQTPGQPQAPGQPQTPGQPPVKPGGDPRGGSNRQQGVEVALVRQDFSDCTNSNVSDQDPSRIGGAALVSRGSDGTTTVKVSINATPNIKYHFFLKCVRLLGDIQTYDEGEGNGVFQFQTNSVGNVFAFDMYPEGAPEGNKFQSVQVKMQ